MEEINLTYEQAEKRLEEIIESLNKTETPLEESLSLVEEATKLTAHCMNILESAKARIVELEN